MNKKNANKLVWVEYWLEQMNQSKEHVSIDAQKDETGNYVCEINFPINDCSIRVTHPGHVEAILQAAEKAYDMIEECIKHNPDHAIRNPMVNYDYEIYVDEDDIVYVNMTKECRERMGKEIQETRTKTMNIINKAIVELQKLYGQADDIYLHITPRDIYDESMDGVDIQYILEKEIEHNTDRIFIPDMSYGKDKYIVTIAHLGRKE